MGKLPGTLSCIATGHPRAGIGKISREGPLTPQIPPLRCAPVEMTKGRAALPATVVAGKAFFNTLGGPTAMTYPVEMTKGRARAALPATVVAEQEPFFIAFGGPKAHDSPVEMTRGRRLRSSGSGLGAG